MEATPNVVFVLVDDMGYGDFGVFGDGSPQTPILDQFVADGVCLTRHWSASAVCAPARAALMTGRYPHRTGAIDTLEGRGLDRLSLRETTMGDCFKEAGYRTGLIGKWHLGAVHPEFHPNARGFDEFAGFRGGWSDYYDWTLDVNGNVRPSNGQYLTDVLADEAIQFIRRHKEEPFFLHMCFNAPHAPLQAPEEDIARFAENKKLNKALRTFYAMVYRMDEAFGRILKELEQQGLDGNTIVVFTSDNGPQFGGIGDQCLDRYNANLRDSKCSVYEGGIRVPAIVRWPGVVTGGRMEDAPVHFTDWLPTLLSAAGLDPAEPKLPLDGRNVWPVLCGEDDRLRSDLEERPQFWQWNRYTPEITSNSAVKQGDWKLVRPAIPETMVVAAEDLEMDKWIKRHPERFSDIVRDPEPARFVPDAPQPQLFNLTEDPSEAVDLSEQHPERTKSMLQSLEAWFVEVEEERREVSKRC
ncbi:arylsulfatase [Paenibacillus sp. strain BS8-2]